MQIRSGDGLCQIMLGQRNSGFLVKINWRGIVRWFGHERVGEVVQAAGVRRNIKRS